MCRHQVAVLGVVAAVVVAVNVTAAARGDEVVTAATAVTIDRRQAELVTAAVNEVATEVTTGDEVSMYMTSWNVVND